MNRTVYRGTHFLFVKTLQYIKALLLGSSAIAMSLIIAIFGLMSILWVYSAIAYSSESSTATLTVPPEASSRISPASTTLRLIDEDGLPIANATARILCFDSLDGALNADLKVQTDSLGQPLVILGESCQYVAAMHLHHTQPSGKPGRGEAYSIYTTSWAPYTDMRVEISGTGSISVVIPSSQPLILFDVVASLAWVPSKTNDYVGNLGKGLESASEYLYDATDGVMAFGSTAVHVNGEEWQAADIRVLPGNDVRPSAQVGGIVPTAVTYTPTNAISYFSPPSDVVTASTVYTPGAIFLGRNWDADTSTYTETKERNEFGAINIIGATDEPLDGNWHHGIGARTIVHEWGHYGLFLYDEYQTVTGTKAYCTHPENRNDATIDTNRSIMDTPYTATELWHRNDKVWLGDGVIGTCEDTKQHAFHRESDCETLSRWYEIQNLPNADQLPPIGCSDLEDESPVDMGITAYLLNSKTTTIQPYITYLPLFPLGGESLPQAATSASSKKGVPEAGTVDARIAVVAETEGLDLKTQVYHLFGEGFEERASLEPYQILHQGQVITQPNPERWQGHMTMLGVYEGLDDVRIFGEHYDGNSVLSGRWYGRAAAHNNATVQMIQTPWHATMDAAYEVNRSSQLINMTVFLTIPFNSEVTSSKDNPPVAQLCNPDSNLRCHKDWHIQAMQSVGGDGTYEVWAAVFEPITGTNELPRYGIVRVAATYPEEQKVIGSELIRWYRVSGVGPGGHNADAPGPDMNDAVVTLSSVNPVRHCNQVIYMPSAHYNALQTPLALADLSILGQAYDIAVRLPDNNGDCPERFGLDTVEFAPGKAEAVGEVRAKGVAPTQVNGFVNDDIVLTIFYPQPSGILEQGQESAIDGNLHVLYFDPETRGSDNERQWERVPPVDSNAEQNWVSVKFRRDGIYAVAWVNQ